MDVHRRITEVKAEKLSGLYEILNSKAEMESDMARQNKLKKTGGLKTNGGLMNKIFKVYMLLMFISCMVLLIVFGIRFSSVYNSQAKSHMNDVTVATETGIEERISQIDQLSVSILINNSVQKNLKSINHQKVMEPEKTSFQIEKQRFPEIFEEVFLIFQVLYQPEYILLMVWKL